MAKGLRYVVEKSESWKTNQGRLRTTMAFPRLARPRIRHLYAANFLLGRRARKHWLCGVCRRPSIARLKDQAED